MPLEIMTEQPTDSRTYELIGSYQYSTYSTLVSNAKRLIWNEKPFFWHDLKGLYRLVVNFHFIYCSGNIRAGICWSWFTYLCIGDITADGLIPDWEVATWPTGWLTEKPVGWLLPCWLTGSTSLNTCLHRINLWLGRQTRATICIGEIMESYEIGMPSSSLLPVPLFFYFSNIIEGKS